jgi:hypothetical protein
MKAISAGRIMTTAYIPRASNILTTFIIEFKGLLIYLSAKIILVFITTPGYLIEFLVWNFRLFHYSFLHS